MPRAARAAAVALALLAAGCGGHAHGPAIAAAGDAAGPTAFAPAAKPAATRPHGRWLTARLRGPVVLRAAPRGRRVARLRARTEFGSPRVLSVVHRRRGWLGVLAA